MKNHNILRELIAEAATSPVGTGFKPPPTYHQPIKERIDRDTYETVIRPLYKTSVAARRDFAAFLAASNHRLGKKAKTPDIREHYYYDTQQRIRAMAAVIETDLVLINTLLATLKSERAARRLKLSRVQSGQEPKRFNGHFTRLQTKLVALRAHENHIAGELADDLFYGRVTAVTWPVVDAIVSRLTNPQTATLSLFKDTLADCGSRYRTSVFEAYGALKVDRRRIWDDRNRLWDDGPREETFCCVEGTWENYTEAVPVIPLGLGEDHARYLFGDTNEAEGHLRSPANALVMGSRYLDKQHWEVIGLAPVPGEPDGYQIVSWRDYEKDRAGVRLSFLNKFRPGKKYMVFAYILALLRSQRDEMPGWWRHQPGHGLTEMWQGPGREEGNFIRKSTLLAMATRIALMERMEALEFLGILEDVNTDGAEQLSVGPRDILISDSLQLSSGELAKLSRPTARREYCWMDVS